MKHFTNPSDNRAYVPTQHLAWFGGLFCLPPEWEVVGYSANPNDGQIDFATRAGLQAQLHWRQCKDRPDELRILAEIHRRIISKTEEERAGRLPELVTARVGAFHVAYHVAGEPCQASLYQEDKGRLVQWLFPEYDPELFSALWQPLLESYQPNNAELRAWAMFGVRAALPVSFSLIKLSAQPANVCFVWKNEKHLYLTIRRWGLPEVLLDGQEPEKFYRRFLRGEGCRIRESQLFRLAGHAAVDVQFEKRGQIGFEKLYGRWWTGSGILWYNETEQRLYAFEQVGRRRVPRLEVSDVVPL